MLRAAFESLYKQHQMNLRGVSQILPCHLQSDEPFDAPGKWVVCRTARGKVFASIAVSSSDSIPNTNTYLPFLSSRANIIFAFIVITINQHSDISAGRYTASAELYRLAACS